MVQAAIDNGVLNAIRSLIVSASDPTVLKNCYCTISNILAGTHEQIQVNFKTLSQSVREIITMRGKRSED